MLSHTPHSFHKKVTEHKMCVSFSLQHFSEKFLSLRNEQDITVNVGRSSCQVPVILVRLKYNLNFLDRYSRYSNIKFHENKSSKNQAVPCRRADGQKDVTKLVTAFCNFANTPKKYAMSYTTIGKNPSVNHTLHRSPSHT